MRDEDEERRNLANVKWAREFIYSADPKMWPKGEKEVNPTRAQTAKDYYDYLTHASSQDIQAGAHLAMLEHEEHKLGIISYPPGHPRRAEVEAGRYGRRPSGFNDRRTTTEAPTPPQKSPEPVNPPVSPTPSVAARANRYGAACAKCGEYVRPGEGNLVRGTAGWNTYHKGETE